MVRSNLRLVKIEDRGRGLCAVFEEDGREFALNAPNLETRIENLRKYHRDTSIEEAALAEIKKLSRGEKQ